jgi:hypothetical protein
MQRCKGVKAQSFFLCAFACAMQVLSKIEKEAKNFWHSGNTVQAGLSNHSALLLL